MKRFSIFAISFLCFPLILPTTILADPLAFHITDLGRGGASGINDNGQVVGYFGSIPGPVVWSRSTGPVTLTKISGLNQFDAAGATDINNAGQIVGLARASYNVGQTVAVLWTNPNSLTPLPNTHQDNSATAINQSGLIVGNGNVSRYSGPVAWQNGVGFQLPLLGYTLQTGPQGDALDVNDAGIIVGSSSIPTSRNRHAVYWENGTAHDLGTLSGDESSGARAVSNNGAIVGESMGPSGSRAFLWTASEGMKLLGSLGGESTLPTAINDNGWVIGNSYGASNFTPFLRLPGQNVADLNSFVDLTNSSFSSLTYAADMNSLGDIVGFGLAKDGSTHAFLISPVPEVQTWLFLLVGLTFIWWRLSMLRQKDNRWSRSLGYV